MDEITGDIWADLHTLMMRRASLSSLTEAKRLSSLAVVEFGLEKLMDLAQEDYNRLLNKFCERYGK